MEHHHHGAETSQRRLVAAAALNGAITIGQVVAGLLAGSLGLLADAAHNLTDTAAVILTVVAFRLATRPVGPTRTYGGVRWPILAAQANAASMVALSIVLAIGAVDRFATPHRVHSVVVVVVALAAAALNGLAVLALKHPGETLGTRSVILHLGGDAMVSVGVAVSGAVLLAAPSATWVDPAVTLVISAVIAWQGVGMLRRTSLILLEAVPVGVDLAAVREAVLAVPGVVGLHDMHLWSLSDTVFAASGHLEVEGHPSLEEARGVAEVVKTMLLRDFSIAHTTLECECDPCAMVASVANT